MKKDLLGLKDISAKEIENILETAGTMKLILGQPNKKTPHLQGKTVVNLFYENSTRTRLSFELAAKYMSANAANITASGSSVQKGETLAGISQKLYGDTSHVKAICKMNGLSDGNLIYIGQKLLLP